MVRRAAVLRVPFVATLSVVAACSSAGGGAGTARDDADGTSNADGGDALLDASDSDRAPAPDSALDAALDADDGGACPALAPTVGAKCVAAGATCEYDDPCPARPTGSDRYRVACTLGHWALVDARYEAPCPLGAPDEGATCLCGAHMPRACGYDPCPTHDEPQLTAICDEKSATWLTLLGECNPPPPSWDAAPSDAPADADAD